MSSIFNIARQIPEGFTVHLVAGRVELAGSTRTLLPQIHDDRGLVVVDAANSTEIDSDDLTMREFRALEALGLGGALTTRSRAS